MSHFPEFRDLHGPAISCSAVSPDVISMYQDGIPPALLEFWKENGWGGYSNGLLWVVNPLDLEQVLHEWLEPDYRMGIAFLRTAFGVVFFWHNGRVYHLDVLHGGGITERTKRVEVLFDVTLCDNEYIDVAMDRLLFKEAFSKLGVLAPDECYGFVPALSMGGSETVENLEKVKLREYLSILAQSR